MKKNVFYTSALALSLALLMGATTFAEARGHMNRGGDRYHDRGAYTELTEEQRTTLTKVYEQHEKGMTEIYAKMRQLDAELYAEEAKETPDSKKIVQLSQDLGALEGQMRSARSALDKELAAKNLPSGRGMMGRGMDRNGYHDGGRGMGRGSYHDGGRGMGRGGYHDGGRGMGRGGYHDGMGGRGYRDGGRDNR